MLFRLVGPSGAAVWLIGLLLLLTSAPALGGERGSKSAPNIVFILTDDLGIGDLSCYGQTHWQTQRLDRMAREGMLFTNAYAGSTVCGPSRATLLTGQHTGHVYQRGNGKVQFRPDPLDVTIAGRLKELGYATAMIGKSGVACNSDDADLPNAKGFDHFYGLLSHVAAHRNYPKTIYRNGEAISLPGNSGYLGDTYANELWVEDALEWMGEQDGSPFFLHLSLTPPHADLTVPERYMEPFRGKFEEKPLTKGGYYHQTETKAAFAGMIAFIDESVGRVLDRLVELSIAESTLVIFASDNGPHAEGGGDFNFFDSNGPYRGGKRDLYEGGIRTPQIAWWPGTVAAGSETDHITAFWDFAPTALELAGGSIASEMDGISIVPTLKGNGEDQRQHEYLYWEFHEQGGKQAVRWGNWKGVRLRVGADRDRPIQVFDLERDPSETQNIAAEHPGIARRLSAMMDEAHEPSERFRFGAPVNR